MYKSSINSPNIGEKISSFLNHLNIPQLSEEEKNSCVGLISSEECSGLLDSSQSNKSPGNDGIPAEFYRKFWPLISESFIGCANECFEKGEMSCSQKQAVITLLEKRGKDRAFLENWPPISLVNLDTKVMSKVIAARVKKVLPSIIHYNQTGYVKFKKKMLQNCRGRPSSTAVFFFWLTRDSMPANANNFLLAKNPSRS